MPGNRKTNSFSERVYQLVRKVPSGRVTSYKEIGRALNSQAYQAIGQTLKNNPYAPQVACHRVVKNSGQIGGFFGQSQGKQVKKKKQLLKKEGINFRGTLVKDFGKVFFKLA